MYPQKYLIPGVITGDKFAFVCIFFNPPAKSSRKRRVKRNQIGPQANISRRYPKYMTDEEVNRALEEYGDRGFDRLPSWLQHELRVRNLTWEPRSPTDLEAWDTIADAREHRIIHNELTIKDYQDKYKRGKPFTIL